MFDKKFTIDQFYGQLRVGKLFGLKCESGHVTVPPRRSCGVCQSMNLEPVELSKRGRIVSSTEVYVKSKDFPVNTPYTLALVRLEEGGNLLGVVNDVKSKAGSSVIVKAVDVGVTEKWPRIFFELV